MSSIKTPNAVRTQSACTDVQLDQITFDWKIKNFHLLPKDVGKAIRSPTFHTRNGEDTWKIVLYPRGIDKEATGYMSMYLKLAASSELKFNADIEFWILKSDDIIVTRSLSYQVGNVGKATGYHRVIETSKLMENPHDPVMIRCKVAVPVRVVSESCPPKSNDNVMSFDLENVSRLTDDFALHLKDPEFSDVTIIVADEKFLAHKFVLASRSTVFAAMFEHKEMEENRKNEVKIENMKPAVMRGMLEFLYTDAVTDLQELASELLAASDKYELERLRVMCEKVLYETLDVENAAAILVLADRHLCSELKQYVLDFIDNHLHEVVKSEDYMRMGDMYPELLKELLCKVARKKGKTP